VAQRVLDTLNFLDIDAGVLLLAASIGPARLRTLDAIHLATALSLKGKLRVVVTYDLRMQEAAGALGLPVAAPA
jgi:predicted nucleic acid-binding protein